MNQLNQEDSPQRSATRAPVNKPVRLQFDDSTEVVEGHCVNVSIGGMYIQLTASRPQGSLVRFELVISEERSIRGLGEVVWMRTNGAGSGREPGVGIKFRFLEQRDRQQIFKLVSQYIKERLSQRPQMMASPLAAPSPPAADEGMIFRPPDTSPAAEQPEALPAADPSALSTIDDFTEETYTPRRADSFLPEVEELAGPLDQVNEAEPWQTATEQEATWQVESASVESFASEESSTEDPPFADEYLAPVKKRPPVFVLAGLASLVLMLVLAFFWGDLFGPTEPYGASVPEASSEGTQELPETTVDGERGTGAAAAEAQERVGAEGPGAELENLASPVSAHTTPSPAPPPSAAPPPPIASSPSVSTASAAAFSHLEELSWRAVPGGLEVVFTTDGSIPQKRWSHFRLNGQTPREVVRILGVSKPFDRKEIHVGGPGVRQIRVGYHKKSRGNELHVVMDLTSPESKISEVRSEGSRLIVRVEAP